MKSRAICFRAFEKPPKAARLLLSSTDRDLERHMVSAWADPGGTPCLTDGGIHGIFIPFGALIVCPTWKVLGDLIPTLAVFVNSL